MNSSLIPTLLVAATLLVSLGPVPDRTQRSGLGPLPVWTPVILKHRLGNGLPVWIVEQHELPVVQMSLLVGSGTESDPPGRYGIASLTSALLTEGAGSRSGLDIADALDALVANLSASSGVDSSYLRLYVPVAALDAALPLMADAALRPTFPEPQLARVRQQRLGTLRGARDDPDAIAALLLARGLYGPTQRSAAPQIGTANSLAAVTPADIEAFHASAYRPDNSTLLVVGDVDADRVLPLIDRHFGKWQPAGAPGVGRNATPEVRQPTRQLLLADIPGAPQSRILVGGISASGSTADDFPIQVLNAVLRERFRSSRNPTLRDHTTGVRSGFDRRRSAGPFAVAAAAQGHKTSEAVAEVLSELAAVMKGVSADELARAKADAALDFSRTFEATGRISSRLQALESLVTFEWPDDHYATYEKAIQAIGADEVQRVATRYFQAEHLVIAIVGDRQAIEPGVRALGIGPLTTVSLDELFAPAR